MNKLFRLKNWLTLEETAQRLSLTMEEKITIADCLQLALDGHLTISALLSESRHVVFAELVKTTKRKQMAKSIISTNDSGAMVTMLDGEIFMSNQQLDYEFEDIERISSVFKIRHGIYDLPMVGAEALDVMHLLDIEQKRNPRKLVDMEGAFLMIEGAMVNIMAPFNKFKFKTNNDGQVQEFDPERQQFVDYSSGKYSSFFYPDDGLGDVEFVFRRENIEIFERNIQQTRDQPLTLDESLLVIGSILNSLKKAQTTSKRWTQDALKAEILDNDQRISARTLDDYFSASNKSFKTES